MTHLLPVDPVTAYIALVLFTATLIRSSLGFGEALVAVPLLALQTPVAVAAPLAVAVSVLVAAVIVVQDWQRIDFRSAGGLVLASLFGIPLGVALVAIVDDRVVRALLGAIIIAYAVHTLAFGLKRHLTRDHWGWLAGCGFASGVLGGAYGMNGPPLVIYGALRRWPPQQFRATLQGYFLPASAAGLLGYALIGLWDEAVTRYFLWSLPGVLLAIVVGRMINRRVSGGGFFRAIHAGLVIIGGMLLVQALQVGW
jgi:uncharacterized membrane protein YfcA